MNKEISLKISVPVVIAMCFVIITFGVIAFMFMQNKGAVTQQADNSTAPVVESQSNQQLSSDNKQPVPEISSTTQEGNISVDLDPSKEKELIHLDKQWNLYVNHKLGFKMKIPRQFSYYDDSDIDYSCYADGEDMVVVIEDYENKAVFIKHKYYYSDFDNKCVEVNLDIIRDNNDYDASRGYHLIIRDVKDITELNGFIKQHYAEDCIFYSLKNNNQGTFDVEFGASQSDKELHQLSLQNNNPFPCFINYWTVLKYSADYQKVASWSPGQEPNFALKVNGVRTDQESEIAKSFQFIDIVR